MIVESRFRPAAWCRNPHAQTVVAGLFRRPPALDFNVETFELADGDFLEVSVSTYAALSDAPVALICPGINGTPDSPYVRGIVKALHNFGIRSAVLHYRGLMRPNRLPITFHSGRTEDITAVIDFLGERFPDAARVAVGYSLGGNMLLKYMGEHGQDSGLAAAAAVSVPFDLATCAKTIRHGLRRVYQRYLLEDLKAMIRAKQANNTLPLAAVDWPRLRSFAAFDDCVTAPLNGFANAADYYARASCGPFLANITTPTLVIHARDDPFMTPAIIPPATHIPDAVRLELAHHGGHVGFVAGSRLGRPSYWLEHRIPKFIEATLSTNVFG